MDRGAVYFRFAGTGSRHCVLQKVYIQDKGQVSAGTGHKLLSKIIPEGIVLLSTRDPGSRFVALGRGDSQRCAWQFLQNLLKF